MAKNIEVWSHRDALLDENLRLTEMQVDWVTEHNKRNPTYDRQFRRNRIVIEYFESC